MINSERSILKVSLMLLAGCFLCVPATEGASAGSAGWTVFRKVQSVRPKALSSTAYLGSDISGILYNPALAARFAGREINVDTGYGFVDERVAGSLYGQKLGNGVGMGAGLFSYDYGTADLSWLEGSEVKERSVSAQNDYLGILAFGKTIGHGVDAGVSAKIASSRIADEATAYALAVDAGLTCRPTSRLALSLVGQSMGATTKFVDKNESLPTAVMGGISYLGSAGDWYCLSGIEAPYVLAESAFKPSAGVELGRWPFGFFAGYRFYANDAALSYGLSLALKNFDFSYSYTPGEWIGSMHRLAIGYRLDGGKDARRDIRDRYQEGASERERRKREAQAKQEEKRRRRAELRKKKEEEALIASLAMRKAISLYIVRTGGPSLTSPYRVDAVSLERPSANVSLGLITLRDGDHPVSIEGDAAAAIKTHFTAAVQTSSSCIPVTAVIRGLTIVDVPGDMMRDREPAAKRVKLSIAFMDVRSKVPVTVHETVLFGRKRRFAGKRLVEVISQLEADVSAVLDASLISLAENSKRLKQP